MFDDLKYFRTCVITYEILHQTSLSSSGRSKTSSDCTEDKGFSESEEGDVNALKISAELERIGQVTSSSPKESSDSRMGSMFDE